MISYRPFVWTDVLNPPIVLGMNALYNVYECVDTPCCRLDLSELHTQKQSSLDQHISAAREQRQVGTACSSYMYIHIHVHVYITLLASFFLPSHLSLKTCTWVERSV